MPVPALSTAAAPRCPAGRTTGRRCGAASRAGGAGVRTGAGQRRCLDVADKVDGAAGSGIRVARSGAVRPASGTAGGADQRGTAQQRSSYGRVSETASAACAVTASRAARALGRTLMRSARWGVVRRSEGDRVSCRGRGVAPRWTSWCGAGRTSGRRSGRRRSPHPGWRPAGHDHGWAGQRVATAAPPACVCRCSTGMSVDSGGDLSRGVVFPPFCRRILLTNLSSSLVSAANPVTNRSLQRMAGRPGLVTTVPAVGARRS